jgi:hypothetical protein
MLKIKKVYRVIIKSGTSLLIFKPQYKKVYHCSHVFTGDSNPHIYPNTDRIISLGDGPQGIRQNSQAAAQVEFGIKLKVSLSRVQCGKLDFKRWIHSVVIAALNFKLSNNVNY